MDITPWMIWFLGCLGRAIDGAQEILSTVLEKARFWDRIKNVKLNDRQRLVINRLLDGFDGKLTTSKYATLAKCSRNRNRQLNSLYRCFPTSLVQKGRLDIHVQGQAGAEDHERMFNQELVALWIAPRLRWELASMEQVVSDPPHHRHDLLCRWHVVEGRCFPFEFSSPQYLFLRRFREQILNGNDKRGIGDF